MSKKNSSNWGFIIFSLVLFLVLGIGVLMTQLSKNFLFKPALDISGTVNLRTGPEVIATGNIVFSPKLLTSNQIIRANLLGNTISIKPNNNKFNPGDQFSWSGTVVGDPNSYVLFSRSGNVYTGDIWWKDVLYQIRYVDNDLYQVRQIDQSKYPLDESPYPRRVLKSLRNNRTVSACADVATQIDVMVLYTDEALATAGNRNKIESEIQQAVLVSNYVYDNSRISHRIELVHMARIDFEESTNSHNDLANLQSLENVRELRDSFAADIVVLIVDSLDYCGEANVMTAVSVDFAESAYAVVKRHCMISNYSFTHELGHIMGARHDCCVDYSDAPFNDAHGFGYIKNGNMYVGTIMGVKGYSDLNNTRLPNFANPLTTNNDGQVLGAPSPTHSPELVPNSASGQARINATCPYSGDEIEAPCFANDSRVLNFTASFVAKFRCRSSRTQEVLDE